MPQNIHLKLYLHLKPKKIEKILQVPNYLLTSEIMKYDSFTRRRRDLCICGNCHSNHGLVSRIKPQGSFPANAWMLCFHIKSIREDTFRIEKVCSYLHSIFVYIKHSVLASLMFNIDCYLDNNGHQSIALS